jgi:cellulose biosynthesis protein BcsQ
VYKAVESTINATRQPWYDAPSTLGDTLQWFKLERIFSKSGWMGHTLQPPWPSTEAASPAIVSFYSFKGGVGRTTAVAGVALLLARAGRRVVVMDLDLEAPGVGSLLLGDITPPDEGIVDYLLETQLLGQPPANLGLFAANQNAVELIGDGQPIRVLLSGQLNSTFLDKIARLDFEGFISDANNPLSQLLEHIRSEYTPDFILLDVRSGLHDLGGLSLNGLSHMDVLFGLDTPQSWAGLEIVLPILGQAQNRREVLLAHAMVMERYDPEANQRFRERSFDLFRDTFYREDEEIPDSADPNAPYGLPIPHQENLLNIGSLINVVDILTQDIGPYTKLVQLIGTYLQRETL